MTNDLKSAYDIAMKGLISESCSIPVDDVKDEDIMNLSEYAKDPNVAGRENEKLYARVDQMFTGKRVQPKIGSRILHFFGFSDNVP